MVRRGGQMHTSWGRFHLPCWLQAGSHGSDGYIFWSCERKFPSLSYRRSSGQQVVRRKDKEHGLWLSGWFCSGSGDAWIQGSDVSLLQLLVLTLVAPRGGGGGKSQPRSFSRRAKREELIFSWEHHSLPICYRWSHFVNPAKTRKRISNRREARESCVCHAPKAASPSRIFFMWPTVGLFKAKQLSCFKIRERLNVTCRENSIGRPDSLMREKSDTRGCQLDRKR